MTGEKTKQQSQENQCLRNEISELNYKNAKTDVLLLVFVF